MVSSVHGKDIHTFTLTVEGTAELQAKFSRGPHCHILMTVGGGGVGGPSDFLGSEILAKSEFFGSMKDVGNFLSLEKEIEGIFWVSEKGLRDSFGHAKKSSDFFG